MGRTDRAARTIAAELLDDLPCVPRPGRPRPLAPAGGHDRPTGAVRPEGGRRFSHGAELHRHHWHRQDSARSGRRRDGHRRIASAARVVWRIEFDSDDPSYAGAMTMTWSFADIDAATLVSVRADDVPAGVSAADHVVGMSSSLAKLAAYVGG
ncbi:MAG: SRPBCC domain-containing protein [Sciscionella sp.]|nr:SRPBCC domain-containing protein [Sciscionella sp.]